MEAARENGGRATFARSHRIENDDDDDEDKVEGEAVEVVAKQNRPTADHACSLLMCDVLCEYGYRTDEKGCSLCECVDPCESSKCSPDEECVIVKVEPCKDETCEVTATCSRKITPPLDGQSAGQGHWLCTSGKPQLHQVQQASSENATANAAIVVDVVKCADAESCADGFDCEIPSGHSTGICCQRPQENTGIGNIENK